MYNNRALYYLKQMGITPWITKNASSESALKLIVLASSSLPKSATHLLQQILASLALDEEHMLLLFMGETDNTSQHPTSCGLTAGSGDLMNNNELINDEQCTNKKISMDPADKLQDVGMLNCEQTLARIPKNESVFWLFFGNELYSKFGSEVVGKSIVVNDLLSLIENPKQKKQVFLDLYPIKHALCN